MVGVDDVDFVDSAGVGDRVVDFDLVATELDAEPFRRTKLADVIAIEKHVVAVLLLAAHFDAGGSAPTASPLAASPRPRPHL